MATHNTGLKSLHSLPKAYAIFSIIFLGVGMIFGAAKPAFAETYLKVCNHSGKVQTVALARASVHESTAHWLTRGWWKIANDQCGTLTSRNIGNYIYLKISGVDNFKEYGSDLEKGSFCGRRYTDFITRFVKQYGEYVYQSGRSARQRDFGTWTAYEGRGTLYSSDYSSSKSCSGPNNHGTLHGDDHEILYHFHKIYVGDKDRTIYISSYLGRLNIF